MVPDRLKERFYDAVADNLPPNEWEVEEYLQPLSGLEDATQREILNQVSVIWPVSHALCYNFISRVTESLTCLHPSQLADWVKAVLDIYEEQGLKQANSFMVDVENNFLCKIRGETGLKFDEIVGRLLPYARGMSGRNLDLFASDDIYTDTTAIFIPKSISLFTEGEDNFLLYKLIITYHCGLLACNVFADRQLSNHTALLNLSAINTSQKDGTISLKEFIASFTDRVLIQDLYQLMASIVVIGWMNNRFPGLMRDCKAIRNRLEIHQANTRHVSSKSKIVIALKQLITAGSSAISLKKNSYDLMVAANDLFQLLCGVGDSYNQIEFPLYWGIIKPAEIESERLMMRSKNKQKFINTFALFLPAQANEKKQQQLEEKNTNLVSTDIQDATAIIPIKAAQNEERPKQKNNQPLDFITIDGQQLEVPETIKQLMNDIVDDLGHIPATYISSAMEIAGRAASDFKSPETKGGEELTGPVVYNEWDFRRGGFRKNWCKLLQKELHPIKSTFMDSTLTKYRGSLIQLKKQFEMLRMQDRFVKRQQEGDEIDLDALIDSLADHRAGLSPSENLYIRLSNDERDIAAVFLVDMSSSTEGWVSTALKESLVLMSEALEILGDRYAIYGFSGMRRTRSELYHIKQLDEDYNDEVKGRIAAIKPIDYTRMGPPIRHLTRMLEKVDSKVRLLITLSDGKPEDYDDYKGDYAIEDTRHALIEAKAAGIHPFCITIDKKAHDYIAHMYGEVNYIFITTVSVFK